MPPVNPRSKHTADDRMEIIVTGTMYITEIPEKELRSLDPANLDHYIAELREGETRVRTLRKRLESLRDKSVRTCPVDQRAVTGRPDRVFCSDACRIKAHRAKKEPPPY